jgi:dihydrolipoamide dehydrogenase
MSQSTQLVVLGGGPGGYAAAFLAADLGLSVTLIDREPNPGGVCLYRGCIPSKAILHVARVITEADHASAWGIEFGTPAIDLDRLRGWKQDVIGKLTGGLGQLSTQRAIQYVQGTGRFLGPRSLAVTTPEGLEQVVAFEHAIIATGSRPTVVPALALESPHVMDSTSALELDQIPGSLLVIGGGYIGLELGTVYAALGSRVSVIEMTSGLLPGADRDLVNVLARRLESVFSEIRLDTRVTGMHADGDGVRVNIEGADDATFDRVLVAVGRRPNSDIPGLDTTGIELDERGFIPVDGQRRTSVPTIFAIGDVVGEPMLAHKASHEGRVAVEVIAGNAATFQPAAIPAVIFTDPEIAWCGLTETEAKRTKRSVEIARFPWAASGRAMSVDRTDGVTKLVLDPQTQRILGVGIVGAGAGELIAEGVLAIEMGAVAADLTLTIHPHPTMSETLMEAAEVFFGQSTHLYRRRKS